MDLWAQIIIPLITLAGGWAGATYKFRSDREQKQAELDQKDAELAQARSNAIDEKERWQEESDRNQLDRAAELCRGDEKQAAQGQAILVGMVAMGNPNPRVRELLDQMTRLELGVTVREMERARAAGELPEIVQEVVVSDSIDVTDGVTWEIEQGEEPEEGDDGGEAQGDQGDPTTGRGR